jgi:hypothetical protein
MRTVVNRDVIWGTGNTRYIRKLSDLICEKHTVRPSDNVSSHFTLRKKWVLILTISDIEL